jgi:hypothetical protein
MSDLDEQSSLIKKGEHGGRRTGAGRQRGARTKKTIEIQEAAKKYAGDALKALAEIATTGTSEAARVSAATALLDRGYGRPRQAIEHTGNVSTSGVLIVPETPDQATWAAEVAQRQAALVALVPVSDDEAA